MTHVKAIIYSLLMCGILNGCAQKQKYDPTKHYPAQDILSTLSNIGVMEPQVSGCRTAMRLYDKEVLKSTGVGAVGGAGLGLEAALFSGFLPIAIITVPVGAVAGAVGGVAAPTEVAVTPTEKQIETFRNSLEKAFVSADAEAKYLVEPFVSDGKRLTSKEFISACVGCENAAVRADSPDKANPKIDATLHSSVKNIIMYGHVADDPKLSITINISFFLRGADTPKQCLGWYGGLWAGEARRLSEWQKDDGHPFKEEIINAYRKIYREAVDYLFNTTGRENLPAYITDTFVSMKCYMAKTHHILNQAEWFCPQADKGLADPQRRIGDIFYYGDGNKTKNDLIRAYVWYSVSAQGNNSEAKTRLIELEKELTSEQLQEARHRLDAGEPGQCMKDLIEAGFVW